MKNTQVQKPLIPSQWYEILKLKKVEVIAQLTARSINHDVKAHISTLKSILYRALKKVKRQPKSRTREQVRTVEVEEVRTVIGEPVTTAVTTKLKTLRKVEAI